MIEEADHEAFEAAMRLRESAHDLTTEDAKADEERYCDACDVVRWVLAKIAEGEAMKARLAVYEGLRVPAMTYATPTAQTPSNDPPLPPTEPPKPKTRSKMTPEELREFESQKKRDQRARKRAEKSSNQGDIQGDTRGDIQGDKGDILGGHSEVSRASEALLFSSFQGESAEVAAVSQISEALQLGGTSRGTGQGDKGDILGGHGRGTVVLLRPEDPAPEAATAAAANAKVTSRDVAREWNDAYQQHRPGGTGHVHSAFPEQYAVIASAVNSYPRPRQVLSALLAWVWIAPNAVCSRVKYPTPKTIVAGIDRDLDNAYELVAVQPQPTTRIGGCPVNNLTDTALESAYVTELFLCSDADLLRRHIATPGRLEPADCVAIENGRIVAKVHELCADGLEVSPITVIASLERDGRGNAARATQALWEKYDPNHLDSFSSMASRLRELARARKIDALLRRASDAVKNLNLEAAEEYAREVIGQAPAASQQVQSLRSAAYLAAYGSEGTSAGKIISTGYHVIDKAIGGLRPGSMWMVGGRTNAGKSKLMLGSALQMARAGHKPGIVTCEDSLAVWGERALAHMSGVRPEQLQQEMREMALKERIDLGIEMLSEEGIQIADVFTRQLSDVLIAIRDLLANRKCDVIFVDYLQAIRLGHNGKRHELVSDAAQQLKSACQAHGVPLVLGSQLSRPDRSDPYGEPSAFALKESGDLENMAEVVTLQWKTSDDDDAKMLGKVAKVKWSPKRPRFQLQLCDAGSLQSLEPVAFVAAQPAASQNEWKKPNGRGFERDWSES